MSTRPRAILFLCVANSARSQMAEGLARSIAPDDIAIHSAGSEPATVHPLAKQVMAELGIDLGTHRSKGVADIPQDEIDLAITLCAEEVCPVFPHDVTQLHWPHPDPAAHGTEGDFALQSFRDVRDQIRERLVQLFADIGEVRG
jgi:arsenate reductase